MLGDAFNVDTMEKMRRPPSFEVEDFELGEKCQDASPSEARPISLNPSLTLTVLPSSLSVEARVETGLGCIRE